MSGDPTLKAQRIRIHFSREVESAHIGHLDLARTWERALIAGGVPVSYSAGRKPQTRITLAAALPSGATSGGELIDVVLNTNMTVEEVGARVSEHLPEGLRCHEIREIGMGLPSLPASVRWAEYDVQFPLPESEQSAFETIATFLAADAFPWEDRRGEKVRHYDLRGLVDEIRIEDAAVSTIFMRLRCGPSGVGRPDQVLRALGMPAAARIHRLRLVLDDPSPARDAWRRHGRFLD